MVGFHIFNHMVSSANNCHYIYISSHLIHAQDTPAPRTSGAEVKPSMVTKTIRIWCMRCTDHVGHCLGITSKQKGLYNMKHDGVGMWMLGKWLAAKASEGDWR